MSNWETFDKLPLPRYKKEEIKMRENIIERILALTDEQAKELLTLIRQSEEANQVSVVPRQASA